MRGRTAIALSAVLMVSTMAFGQSVDMHELREAVTMKSYAAAPRIAANAQLAPAATLGAADEVIPEELHAIGVWNAEGGVPAKNGVTRALGESIAVSVGGAAVKSGRQGHGVVVATARGVAFGTSFRVERAKRLRLHLENVELPAGTTLWVYGTSDQPFAFDGSLVDPQKSLWTPSVDGDTIYLEMEVPSGVSEPASFDVREVLELLTTRNPKFRPEPNDPPTCLPNQDVNCQSASEFSVLDAASRAVGQMEYVKPDGGYVCTGTLITDQQKSGTPYFLTANHCISDQSSATSLETYFDYKFLSCGSPNFTSLPRVVGSTLLVTSAATDVSLLRLSSIPANRVLLGWTADAAAVPSGTHLHRVSHPVPDGSTIGAYPQLYSRTIVVSGGPVCSDRNNYISSNESGGGEGGVYGGSSGSAIMLNNGQIVGQLRGSCGPDPAAGCDRRNNTVDGAFSASFSLLRTHLASTGITPPPNQPCVPNSSTICLVNDRFSVNVKYDVGQGPQNMTAIEYTPNSGLFWFADSSNIEVLLKMIDACAFNSRFWVYAGGTTDVGVTITVTDTKNGTVKTYNNPRGTKFATITDGTAFATCP